MLLFFKQESNERDFSVGKVYMNKILAAPFFNNTTSKLFFAPLTILNAQNDPSWEVRIAEGIIESLKDKMMGASPNETGGVFVGCANYKTKTIHVVGVIDAPADSHANEVCFFRGVEGLPEEVTSINNLTGGQLGYIGEWHTHPNGPNGMSTVDAKAVRNFKRSFEELPTPLPVFLIILTDTQVLAYVY